MATSDKCDLLNPKSQNETNPRKRTLQEDSDVYLSSGSSWHSSDEVESSDSAKRTLQEDSDVYLSSGSSWHSSDEVESSDSDEVLIKRRIKWKKQARKRCKMTSSNPDTELTNKSNAAIPVPMRNSENNKLRQKTKKNEKSRQSTNKLIDFIQRNNPTTLKFSNELKQTIIVYEHIRDLLKRVQKILETSGSDRAVDELKRTKKSIECNLDQMDSETDNRKTDHKDGKNSTSKVTNEYIRNTKNKQSLENNKPNENNKYIDNIIDMEKTKDTENSKNMENNENIKNIKYGKNNHDIKSIKNLRNKEDVTDTKDTEINMPADNNIDLKNDKNIDNDMDIDNMEDIHNDSTNEFDRSSDVVLVTNKYDISRATKNVFHSTPKPRTADDEEGNDWVAIGTGATKVHKNDYKTIKFKSHTVACRALLMILFTRDELATHSLTGRPSPAFPNKPAKTRLDWRKTSDIIIEVVKKCNVKDYQVRTAITSKCADESRRRDKLLSMNKNKTSKNQENISPNPEEKTTE